ncbi:hypothetical protein Emed_001407 [Eimeria media]
MAAGSPPRNVVYRGQKTARASDAPSDAPTAAALRRGLLQQQGQQEQQQHEQQLGQQQQQQHEQQQNVLLSELLLRRCLSSHLPPSSPELLPMQPQSIPWASLLGQTGLDSLASAKQQQQQQHQQQQEELTVFSPQRRCRGGNGQTRGGAQRCEQKQAGSPLCKRSPQSPPQPPPLSLPKGASQAGLVVPLPRGPLSAGGGGAPTSALAARADITLGGNKPHYHVAKQEWRVRYYMSGKRKMRTYSAKFYGYEAAHSMAKDFAAYVDTHEALPLQQLLPPSSAAPPEVKASPNISHRRISLLQQQQQAALAAAAAVAAAGGTPSTHALEGAAGESQDGGAPSFLGGGGPPPAETAASGRGPPMIASSPDTTPRGPGGLGWRSPPGSAAVTPATKMLRKLLQQQAAAAGAEESPTRASSWPRQEQQQQHQQQQQQGQEEQMRRKRNLVERREGLLGERSQSLEQTVSKVDTEETALCLQMFLREFVRDKLRNDSKGPRSSPSYSQQDCLAGPLGGPLDALLRGEGAPPSTSFYYSNTSSSSNEAEGQQPSRNSSSSSRAPSAASLPLCKAPPSAAAAAASAAEGKGVAATQLSDLLQLGCGTGVPQSLSVGGPLPPSELLTFSKIVVELTSSTCLLLFELKEAISKAVLLVEADAKPAPPPPPAAAAAGEAKKAAQNCGASSTASSAAEDMAGVSSAADSHEVAAAVADAKLPTSSTLPCLSSTTEEAAKALLAAAASQAEPQQQQQQQQQSQRQLEALPEEAAEKAESACQQQQQQRQQRAEETVRRAFALLARHQKLAAAITQLQLPIPVFLHCLIKATSPSFLPLVLPSSNSNNSSSSSGSQQQESALVIDSESALQALFLRPFDVFRCRCSERPCACDQQHLVRMLRILSLILSKAQQGRGDSEGGAPSQSLGQRGALPDPIQVLSRIIPGIAAKESLQHKQQQQHVCAAAASCSSSTLPSSASPNTTCRCSPVTSPDVFMTLRPTAAAAAAAAATTGETPEALQLPPHQGTAVTAATTTTTTTAAGGGSAEAEEQSSSSSSLEQTLADMLGAALIHTTKALGPEASVQFQEQLLQHRWQQHKQQQLLLPPRLPFRSMLALVPPLQSLLHTLAQIIVYRHWSLVASYIKNSCPGPQAEVLLELHGHALQTFNPAAAAAGDAAPQEASGLQTHALNNNNSSSSRGTTSTSSNRHQSLSRSCSISGDAAGSASATAAAAAVADVFKQDDTFAPLKRKWLAGGDGEGQPEGFDATAAAGAAASVAPLLESLHHEEVSLEKLLS